MKGNGLQLEITIPANSTARIYIPGNEKSNVLLRWPGKLYHTIGLYIDALSY